MSFDQRKDIKDFVTDAWRDIAVDHSNIHEGEFFEYASLIDIAAGGSYVVSMYTNDTAYIHYRNEKLSSSGEKILLALQEGSTISGGDFASPLNHNRISSKASTVTYKTGVTLATAGTTVSVAYIGGGTGVGGSRSGGETSQNNEYVLKQNTQYTIKVTNNGAGTATVLVSPQWYEEERG